MAVTFATITKAAAGPGPRLKIEFVPQSTNETVTIAAEGYTNNGAPFEMTTTADGSGSVLIPLGLDQNNSILVWDVYETPVDRIPFRIGGPLKRKKIADVIITADADYATLISEDVEPIAVTPDLVANVGALVTDAEAARDAALAVGSTNDAIIASRVNDPASATSVALEAVTLRGAVGNITSDTAATAGRHNPVDATSASRTITLADPTRAGQVVSISKVDTTTNTVTITGSIVDGAATMVLTQPQETVYLTSTDNGFWYPVARSGEDIGLARLPGASVDATSVAWALGTPLALFDMQDTAAPLRNVLGVAKLEVPLVEGSFSKSSAEPGPFGDSLVLNGSTSYLLELGNMHAADPSRQSDEFTIHMWHKSNTVGSTSAKCPFAIHTEGSHAPARVVAMYVRAPFYGGPDRFSPHIGCQDGPTAVTGYTYPFNKDYAQPGFEQIRSEWHMWTVTWKDGILTAYVDGIATGWSYTEPSNPTFGQGTTYTKNPLDVGRPINRSATPRAMSFGAASDRTAGGVLTAVNKETGWLGGVGIWDRAATPEQVMRDRLATLLRDSTVDPVFQIDFAQTNVARTVPSGGTPGAETYTTVEVNGGAKAPDTRGFKAYTSASGTDHSNSAADLSRWHLYGLNGSDNDMLRRGNNSTTTVRDLIFADMISGLKLSQLRRITWLMHHHVAGVDPVQIVLRLQNAAGTVSYAISETSWTCASAHTVDTNWTAAESFTYAVRQTAANWRDLTLTPGSALTIAGAVRGTDLDWKSYVTGIGFYNASVTANTLRIGKLKVWSRDS